MGSANFGNPYPQTPLLRNGSSLYSLTFDEVQNFLGEPGANLGSMNMDELLRNMWTAEESQAMAAAMNPVEGLNRGLSSQFSLQKQGSLCLPRTLSVKTVEDVWKTILPQQGNTEPAPAGVNHERQISLEDFLAKAGVVKERPPRGEVTLEDFLVKAGFVSERSPSNQVSSNQAFMASGNQTPSNQVQQVSTIRTGVPSNQAHQVPTIRTVVPSNQAHQVPTIRTVVPSNQAQQVPTIRTVVPSNQAQQVPTIRMVVPSNQAHQVPTNQLLTPSNQLHQASTIQTLTPSNQVQQQVPPIPVYRQATPIHSSPVHQQVSPNQAFMGFGGFPIPRNDGGLDGQAAPSALNSFIPTATNVLSCPPSSGKTRLDALNMFLPGQQSDWMNNPYGKSITHQNQIMQRQAIAEAASACGSVSNASNAPCLESSPGRLSPFGGGLGAVLGTGGLGTSLGGSACPTRISFGPCSPLSPEFDEGSPSNLPMSLISEFGNGQPQKKKRSAEPPVERVIERRQRRMIKNRESAARSRARKQAYTVELEAEVSQLKEENLELLRKQEEEAALRKKQIFALMPSTPETGYKGRSLKRTHTGPW